MRASCYQIFGSDSDDDEEFLGFPMVEQNNDESSDESSEDEVEEPTNDGDCQWTQQARNVPTPVLLKDSTGVLVGPRERSAKGYFQLLFPDSLFQHIVDQTNLFTRQLNEENLDDIDLQWWNEDGTSKDTSAFIIMGILKL